MKNKTRLPPAYLRAKLNIINLQLEQIPPIVHGRHRGQEVLRQYQVVNGKRRIVETMATSRDGLDWSCKMNLRKDLIKIKKQLENMLIYEPDTKLVNTDKVKTIYNKQYWDNVRVRADFETKTSGYEYRGMMMDSRGEMIVAQTLDELGLQYKYEPMVVIGDEVYYPDFIVYLPEFQRCFFIEFMGRLDDDRYINRNKFKMMDYLRIGMVINKDILIFCGYENSMISADEMKDDIIALISKYCRIYS